MSVTVPIALFGWIPLILVLFAALQPRRAVLAAYLIGWMFLPMASFKIAGIPEYSKVTATNVGVLLGVLLFDLGRLTTFRPRLIDLPMAIWCGCSYVSSMQNGLGAYDGASAVVYKVLLWGIPYFIGRIYLTDLRALREAATAVFIGGLVYMPLCLLEIKVSPQLHRWVYGYFQHDFAMTIRLGGYRPMVFMQHGLMVAMWMTTSALCGLWLWQTKSIKRLWGMPMGGLVAALMVTAVLCKSINALFLMGLGIGVLYGVRWFRTRAFVVALVAVAPMYLVLRISGVMDGRALVSLATDLVGKERAESLKFRIDNEDLLVGKAMKQPLFGWGGWNRYRVIDEDGNTQGITDGMWVIAIGENGLVGLTAATTALLLPTLLLTRRLKSRDWSHPLGSAAAVLSIVGALHMIDNLPNGMFNPVYVLAVGGLASLRKRQVADELEEWEWENGMLAPPAMPQVPTYADLVLPPAYGAAAGPVPAES